tara:strand:- start:423 stop:641 length:219 start_codon:yes stop_codon:yes gene_type:complete
MEWEPIYAELANKMRWAIASTAQAAGQNYTFTETMAVANYCAGDVLKFMKLKEQSPDVRALTPGEVEKLVSV